MEIMVKRTHKTDKATIGELYLDGKFFCYTLEDVDRGLQDGGAKVYGATAIPEGRYNVVINMSNRFKRLLPLVQNVPNFEGVRIHPGNSAADTEGCILVGRTKQPPNFIGQSQDAFKELFDILRKQPKITLYVCSQK